MLQPGAPLPTASAQIQKQNQQQPRPVCAGLQAGNNCSVGCSGGQPIDTIVAMTARTIWILALALGAFLAGTRVAAGRDSAQSPAGQFECRDWESQPTILLAVLVLRADGTYEATDRVDDLNAHRPTTTGRYSFTEDKQQIDWTSGGWKDRIGTYMPHVRGSDVVLVHTKRDPENKAGDGTLRCARTPSPQ